MAPTLLCFVYCGMKSTTRLLSAKSLREVSLKSYLPLGKLLDSFLIVDLIFYIIKPLKC
jgi:hypothetical protein